MITRNRLKAKVEGQQIVILTKFLRKVSVWFSVLPKNYLWTNHLWSKFSFNLFLRKKRHPWIYHNNSKHFRRSKQWRKLDMVKSKDNLTDVTWEQATTKIPSYNTIAALVYHIHYYIEILIPVLQGGKLEGAINTALMYRQFIQNRNGINFSKKSSWCWNVCRYNRENAWNQIMGKFSRS